MKRVRRRNKQARRASELPVVVERSVTVVPVRYQGRDYAAILVGDRARSPGIRKAEPELLAMRDRLTQNRGLAGDKEREILEGVATLRRAGGKTYAQIAQELNAALSAKLDSWWKQSVLADASRALPALEEDTIALKRGARRTLSAPLGVAQFLLALRFKPEAIERTLEEAVQRMERDLSSFRHGGPITRERLISAARRLKRWKEEEEESRRKPPITVDR